MPQALNNQQITDALASLTARVDKLDGGATRPPAGSPATSPAGPKAPPANTPVPAAGPLPVVRVRDGQAAHVRVSNADLERAGDGRHLAPWAWDAGGEVDYGPRRADAFNFAWCYGGPGEYVATLNGEPHARIVVEPDRRVARYVETADELYAAAASPDARVVVRPAELTLPRPLRLGDGASVEGHRSNGRTRLAWAGPPSDWSHLVEPGRGCLLRRLHFDDPAAESHADKTRLIAVAGADDLTLVECVFGDVTDGLNCNRRPSRVFAGGCRDEDGPDGADVRGYPVWGDGEQIVVVGCEFRDSTREHCLRFAANGDDAPGARFVAVCDNDLANLDRRPADAGGDPHNYSKTTVALQAGEYHAVTGNRLAHGPVQIGPLGRGGGKSSKAAVARRTRWQVARGNNLSGGYVRIELWHGAEDPAAVANRFDATCTREGGLIVVIAPEEGYDGRVAVRPVVRDNVAALPSQSPLLRVEGEVEGLVEGGNRHE